MACHLNRFCSIAEFKTVCTYLGLGRNLPLDIASASAENKEIEQDLDGWNNNWEWGMDAASAPPQLPNGVWPSSSCLVSMTSFADTLVVAHGQHAVFLNSKWVVENDEEKLKFTISSSKRLTSEANETVTSVLCIPLSSQRRSQPTGPDWTCIAVGFSSGFLRVYTQEGELLISQCLKEGAIRRLVYQNNAAVQLEGSLGDLVAICGDSCIITLDAFSFHQTVKACRSHLARAKAGQSPMIQPPTLVFKKWMLQDFHDLSDCCLLGTASTPPYDTLVWESVRGGPGCYPKMLAPSTNILLSAGLNFFLGNFHFTPVSGHINLSDMMGAVTSKLKSALLPQAIGKFNFWGKSPSTEDLPVEPATSVSMRYGFYDKRRKGLSLLLSPNSRLAVLTDSFGRVILFDVQQGICSRMWKGYRDAQCAWVECEEEDVKKSKHTSRKAVFLIIYAPRRGILQVWSVPEVFRIAAFTVSKSALLICPGYCVMGANVADFPRNLLYPCCLLEPDGKIATIQIPFSTALKTTRSCPQKDVYLLTDLQQLLKEGKENMEQEIKNLFQNIHSISVLQKALNSVLSEDHLNAQSLQECLMNFVEHRLSMQIPESVDPVVLMGQRLLNILKIFSRFSDLSLLPLNPAAAKTETPDIKILSETLKLSEEEVKQLTTVVSWYDQSVPTPPARPKRTKRVSFSLADPNLPLTYREFLKAFDWSSDIENAYVCFRPDINNDWKQLIGSLMFESAIEDENRVPIVKNIVNESPVKSDDLLELLLQCWLSKKDTSDRHQWINFHSLLQMITEKGNLDCKLVFPLLSASTNAPGAYVACVLLRSLMSEATPTHPPKSELGEWETLTEEHVRWNLLHKRLEDVVVLCSLLRSRGNEHAPSVSVQMLLDKGPGAVSEVVAEWIVRSNTDVQSLYKLGALSDTNQQDENQTDVFKAVWQEVTKRFARSLECDAMLANCSWEQMVVWSKEPDDIGRLTAALKTLQPITSAILKNGVGCMMWKTFVVNRFEALTLLVEKVGKTPKERLCKQDLSMCSMYLGPFLEFCCQLLDIIIEANIVSDVESLPDFPLDDMWREGAPVPNSISGSGSVVPTSSASQPLVVLAYNQPPSNYVLLYHHNLLSLALILIINFGLKNTRPLGFYDLKGRQAFFHELQGSYAIPQTSLPFKVVMGRTNFLQRVACAIAHSLPDPPPPTQTATFQEPDASSMEERRTREREASRWLNRTLELAKGWDVSLDEIRRHYICQLYYCGHDSIAEECLGSVTDYLSLGSQLLLLAGQRVASALLASGQDEASCLAYLSPTLSKWLKALDLTELTNATSSLSAVKQVLSHAINLTSEDSPEHKRAVDLFEAIVTEKLVFPS